jgi:predicted acyl esterase
MMRIGFIAAGLCLVSCAALCTPVLAADPNETPAKVVRPESSFDYIRRVVDIAMRDGVKLHTVILIPRGTTHAPIISPARPTMPKTRPAMRIAVI